MRVYVETTVWSFVYADDSPDYQRATVRFMDLCRRGIVTPVVSTVVLEEIERTPGELRGQLVDLVRTHAPAVLPVSAAARSMADALLRHRAVPPSKPDDALHVGVAFVERVDAMASWNFKHLANQRRTELFNAIAAMHGVSHHLPILRPEEFDDA